MALSGHRHGSVQPQDRGLGDGRSFARRPWTIHVFTREGGKSCVESVGVAGPTPSPQVKWPNDIIGPSRLLQQYRRKADIRQDNEVS